MNGRFAGVSTGGVSFCCVGEFCLFSSLASWLVLLLCIEFLYGLVTFVFSAS